MNADSNLARAADVNGEESRTQISALVDGELDDAAIERAIDALLASDDLADFWADAHRAGDWMRSDEVVGVGDGVTFLARFSARLATEPAIVAPKRSGRSRSRRFWVRTGLPGASVAAALVVVAWVALPLGGQDKAVATVAILQAPKGDEGAIKPTEFKPVDPDRFSDYLAAHGDVTPFAYRGEAAARPASFTTVIPAANGSPSP